MCLCVQVSHRADFWYRCRVFTNKKYFAGIITNSTGGRCVSQTTPTTCSPLHQRAPTSPTCGLAPSRDPDSLSSSSTSALQQQTSRAMRRASKLRVLCQTRAMRFVGVRYVQAMWLNTNDTCSTASLRSIHSLSTHYLHLNCRGLVTLPSLILTFPFHSQVRDLWLHASVGTLSNTAPTWTAKGVPAQGGSTMLVLTPLRTD
jgi:hypothetical protein